MNGEWLYWIIVPVFITISLLGSYSFSRVKSKKRSERSHMKGRSIRRKVHTLQQEQNDSQSQQSSSTTTERIQTTSLRGSLSRAKSSQRIVKDGKVKKTVKSHSIRRKQRMGKSLKFRPHAPSANDDERTEFEEVGVVKRPAICKTRIVLKWKKQTPLKRKSESTSQSLSKKDSDISESRSRSKKSPIKRKIKDAQRVPSEKSRGTLDTERSIESSERNHKRTQRSSRSTKGNRQQIDINISRVFDVPIHRDAHANLERTTRDSGESIVHSKADSRYMAREMQHDVEIPAWRKSTTEKKSNKPQRIAKIRKKKFEESQILMPTTSDASFSDASISLQHIDDHTKNSSTTPLKSPMSSSSSSSSQYSKMTSVDRSIDTGDLTGTYRGNSAPSINGNTKKKSVRVKEDRTEVTSESRKRNKRKQKRQDEATMDSGKSQNGGHDRKSVVNEVSPQTVSPSQNSKKEGKRIVNKITTPVDESEPSQDSKISSTQSEKEAEQGESGKENKQSNQDIRKLSDDLLRRKEEQKYTKKEREEKEIRKKSIRQERKAEAVKDKTETRKQSAEGSGENAEKSDEGDEGCEKKVDEVSIGNVLAKEAHAQKPIDSTKDSKQEGKEEEGEMKYHIASPREEEGIKSNDEIINEKKDKIMHESGEMEKQCKSSEQYQSNKVAKGSAIVEKHPQQQLTSLPNDMPFVSPASSSFTSPRTITQEKSSPMNSAEASEKVLSQMKIGNEHAISGAESNASLKESARKVNNDKHIDKTEIKANSDMKNDESNAKERHKIVERFVDDHTMSSETESTERSDTPSSETLRDTSETALDKNPSGSVMKVQQNIEKERESEKEESTQHDDESETLSDRNSSGNMIRVQQNIQKERESEEEETTQIDETNETVADENSSRSVIRVQQNIHKESEKEESTQHDDASVGEEDESQEDDDESTDTQHRKENSDVEESPRRIAGQVLDIINKNNFFMNTVTHDQDVLLKGFFASEVKFDEDVESAIFIALNLAIERVICTALNHSQRQFLSQRSAAINTMFACMQYNVQQFVPACWRPNEAKGTIETKEGFKENNSPSSPTEANEKQD